jgi:ribonuclease Z
MNSLWNHKQIFRINNKDLKLCGYSIAGIRTGFYIPQLKIMLDAGNCSPFNPEFIFISHLHSDHTQSLPMILTNITTKPKIFVPVGTRQLIMDYILSFERMTRYDNSINEENMKDKFQIIEVQPNMILNLMGNYKIQIFETFHGVPSVGYAIFETKTRLKEEYKNNTRDEIIELRRNKINIMDEILLPVLAYTGDTTPIWLDNELFMKNDFPLVISECTFINQLSMTKDVSSWMHTSLEQLEYYINIKPKTQFVLIHWSQRYSKNDIDNIMSIKGFNNVIAWTDNS